MPSEITRTGGMLPSVFDDFFKPWSEWFTNGGRLARMLTVPSVNITESEKDYKLSLAAPGLKKEDLRIDVDGNVLTISAEKEQTPEPAAEKYSRREYSYSSFSRSFTLPDNVQLDRIDARYTDGVLEMTLPKKEEALKKAAQKQISVQ
ncbi:Hsp20/alpha crystallin family protein [Paraflavisolibacter sp. H34]|uniref:Hsp20/alpha crystallin family protein n=1 Tax=Huijunlia imazamoxiresistens TaxID=3127457 RepID=UPI0030173BEB